MPFNGSGVFSRIYTWATEALTPPIAISKLDEQETDIATALSNCLLRDGTGLPTATADWNAQRLSNLGAATAGGDAVRASQIQAGGLHVLGSVAGTNTITGNLTPALTAYTAGMHVTFTPANNNTGATTIAINGLTALDIQKADGDALVSGDLVAGIPAVLVLDAGADDWILLNPQASINGIATSDFARLSQANSFLAAQTISHNTNPIFRLSQTGAAADNTHWLWQIVSEQARFGVESDSGAVVTNWLTIDRTGTTVDAINLQATAVQVNGTTLTPSSYLVASSSPTLSGSWTFSNVVLGPGGSASAPSFSFSGDTNTGLYRSSSDVVGIAAGGASVMSIGGGGVEIAGQVIGLDSDGSRRIIYTASGSPEGVLAANVGSIYMRNDGGAGSTFYVKESGTGSTGWVAK